MSFGEKLSSHEEEGTEKTTEKFSITKQKVQEALKNLEETGKPVNRDDIGRIRSILREDGPLADDPDREEMLERLNSIVKMEEIRKKM